MENKRKEDNAHGNGVVNNNNNNSNNNEIKVAHSCEHAFIGSLQSILKRKLKVKKVDHRNNDNLVVIDDVNITKDDINAAQKQVNLLIQNGRKINSYFFPSLNEAEKSFPDLRANRERILGPEIRVVEIENHDLSACSKQHVDDLKECRLFMVSKFTKTNLATEITFVSGQQAIEASMMLVEKILSICDLTKANINTLEETIKKIIKENDFLKHVQKLFTNENLLKLSPIIFNDTRIYLGKFSFFNDHEIRNYVAEKLSEKNNIFIIANRQSEDKANLILARSHEMTSSPFDFSTIFLEEIVSKGFGKGGGKSTYINGTIDSKNMQICIDNLYNALISKLS